MRAFPYLIICIVFVGLTSATGQDRTKTTRDAIITEAQVRRGDTAFETACSSCHSVDQFKGGFYDSWAGSPLSSMYDQIRKTMPEDRPSSLRPQAYADILALILEANGTPKGAEELTAEPSELQRILIQPTSNR